MKVIVLNQKTAVIRHWFKWYIVSRSGRQWKPTKLDTKRLAPPFDLKKAIKSMEKAGFVVKP